MRKEFGSRRGLIEACFEALRSLARVGGQNGALKIVRVHGSLDKRADKSVLLLATQRFKSRQKTRSAVIDGLLAARAHGEPRLAAQRAVTLPCGTTQ